MTELDKSEYWRARCHGMICACCEVELPPERHQQPVSHCVECAALGIREAVMWFVPSWDRDGNRKGYGVAFLEPDCRTHLPRSSNLRTKEDMLVLVSRTMRPERALADLETQLRMVGQGSVALHLSAEQYAALRR